MIDVEAYRGGAQDGKLLSVGYTSANQLVLARFNPDGSADGTFGDGGFLVQTGVGVPKHLALDIADRILVSTTNSITRFTPDGGLDDTFGACHCGRVTFPSDTTITALAADLSGADAGEVMFAGSAAGALAGRLTVSGDLRWERTFKFTNDPGSAGSDWTDQAGGIAEVPGGKTVVGGDRTLRTSSMFRTHRLGIARFLPDGSLDTSFGSAGVANYAPPDGPLGWWATATSIAVDSTGGVLVATKYSGSPADCGAGLIMRVDAHGALDPAFGNDSGFTDGYVGGFEDIAIDANGRILTAGRVDCHEEHSTDAGVRRFTESGQVDTGFNGGKGDLTAAEYSPQNHAYGMTLDARGPVIAGVGTIGPDPTQSSGPFLTRFLSEPTDYSPPANGSGGVASDVVASPGIDVHRVITPKTWRKLINPGVRVLASCNRDCRMDVTVTVSSATARAIDADSTTIGFDSTTIARGSAEAAADSHRWISAKALPSLRGALRAFSGRGRLRITVTASARS